MSTPDFNEVQGNVLGGFSKDHQTLLMMAITDPNLAKVWLRGEACDDVATASEVIAFNKLFKSIRGRRGERATVKSTWMNVAFTRKGLELLGAVGVPQMDAAFASTSVTGQAVSILGDAGSSAPTAWPPHYQDDRVHVVFVVASDERSEVDKYLADHLIPSAERNGLAYVVEERGDALPGSLAGHEHFGFKDGVSQPRVVGVDDAGNVEPWAFIVDANSQQPPTPPALPPGYAQQPAAPPAPAVPLWVHQGSYLVFRRLRQDVALFEKWVENERPNAMPAEQFAAKIVGRYRSGAPYAAVSSCPGYDPSKGDPALRGDYDALRPENVNTFTYAGDDAGVTTPLAAHIRKTNPRESLGAPSKRIIRRGIAYGSPYDPSAEPDTDNGKHADRGLLFLCYQASIFDQFQFIQKTWANTSTFPSAGAGVDPIIGPVTTGATMSIAFGGDEPPRLVPLADTVITTGMLYCFSPSISALRQIGS